MSRYAVDPMDIVGSRLLLVRTVLAATLWLGVFLMVPWFPSPAAASCPNQQFRFGYSAGLPDCRAYELVTPPDSDGRNLRGLQTVYTGNTFPTEAGSGASFLFTIDNSPLQELPEANGELDGYESVRSPLGWRTVRRLTLSGSQAGEASEGSISRGETGGISADHRYDFTTVVRGGSLVAANGPSTYLGNPDGSFELLGVGSLATEPLVQGRYISPTASHIIFQTGGYWCASGFACPRKRLEQKAAPTGTISIYDRSPDGPTSVISLLPGNVTPVSGQNAEYQGTSRDGSTVAFKVGGTLYLRIDDAETKQVTAAEANYAGFSADGRFLFYVREGDIFRFDVATGDSEPVNASGDAQIVNVSEDGSHVYFVSPSQLDGNKGTAGQPNLYVWSGGAVAYVATLAASDVESEVSLTDWTDRVVTPEMRAAPGPAMDPSRTTPDGSVLVFESQARLTPPYDNAGHTEIYRYDDSTKEIQCVSCSPSGKPATSDARLQSPEPVAGLSHYVVIHNLSTDGTRVFFETSEALTSADQDTANDIYEWEAGPSDTSGAVALLSGGRSVQSAKVEYASQQILGISPSGDDVFFLSAAPLLPAVGPDGFAAVYDARVDGGLAPEAGPGSCLGEDCQPVLAAPSLPLALSDRLHNRGNVRRRPCSRRSGRRCHRKHRRHRKHGERHRRAARSSASTEGSAQAAAGTGATTAVASGPSADGYAAAAAADSSGAFGFESASAEESSATAGSHADFTTSFAFKHRLDREGKPLVLDKTKSLAVALPPGLVGAPLSVSSCTTTEFLETSSCPIDSQVGVIKLTLAPGGTILEPVFNLKPPHPKEEVARFGFRAAGYPVFLDASVRSGGDYGVTVTAADAPSKAALLSAETTFWGVPADPRHDEQRLTMEEASSCPGTPCLAPEGKRSSNLTPKPFLTNPTACEEQHVDFTATSYQLPGQSVTATAPMPPTTGCQNLYFQPSMQVEPTSNEAGAPTGLHTVLRIPQTNNPDLPATASMRDAKVTLPEGMTLSPAAANGLEGCSEEQAAFGTDGPANCPDAAQLGTATFVSPALPEALHGAIYARSPRPGHLFGLWLVSDEYGLNLKLPGEIETDPTSGRLTVSFEETPQLPVEEIDLELRGGARAPLVNPSVCGSYRTEYELTPWSGNPPTVGTTPMTIEKGCNAGGFNPSLEAGLTRAVAGSFSPLVLNLTRPDGDENLSGFKVELPKGLLAKLKGVPLCSDEAAATGACPGESQIGHVAVAAGPGPQPLWIPQPGKAPTAIYLAGPYKGAPYSVITKVPAQAGPFDLGNVAVRGGIYVNPDNARASVAMDDLPQILEGVPVLYRTIHAEIDRKHFALAPTNCEAMKVESTVSSVGGALAHPADRFQVGECGALRFRPKLDLKLSGGTKRAAYPALTATLETGKDEANIRKVSVALPHSEFLAQEHLIGICTRVRFAANDCPKGSVYGWAKARTPLLSKPLEGPVYLRSSNQELPDLVAALHGQLDINLVGHIDSFHEGMRTTFAAVPDAPVTKFVLRMRGGKKSLLRNSTDVCVGSHSAVVKMAGQNGRVHNFAAPLRARCGGK